MRDLLTSLILYLVSIGACMANTPQTNIISKKYVYSSISIDQGLPINFIDDIYKDSKGFIWVSTQGGGLSRYDGYEFLKIDVNSYPVVLKSNFIRKTIEDNFHRLWVVSDLGLDIINLETMSLETIEAIDSTKALTSTPDLYSVQKDSIGNIWITGNDKIARVSFDNLGTIKKIIGTKSKVDDKNNTLYPGIIEIGNQIKTAQKGRIYNIVEKENFLQLIPVPDFPNLGEECAISSIIRKNLDLWIGTDRGLFRYNLKDKTSVWYFHFELDQRSISQNMITDLALTKDSTLVISTLRGLNFYNSNSNDFERVVHTPYNSKISSDFINCMLSDGNVLWIGTEAGGINKIITPRLSIQNYTHNDNDRNSISANPINAITEDYLGNLWVGSVEGGLNLKKKGESKFIHFTTENGQLSHNTVSALEEDADGNLWIGTWGNGLNILKISSLDNPQFKQFIPKLENVELSYISSLNYDSKNNGIWIGALQGICFYDIATSSIISPLPNNITNKKSLPDAFIDTDNTLWAGTDNGLLMINLNTLDKKKIRCNATYLELDDNMMDNLFLKNVTSIYQSKDGKIWLGSKGYGFCILKKEVAKWSYKLYTTNQGLANNMVLGILEDKEGILWMSTGYGISSYNPETNSILNYTKNDGINEHQFYWNASYKSPFTSHLYFGSINGLTEIKSSLQSDNSIVPHIAFTKLQVLNETVFADMEKYLKEDISYTNEIDLHESDRSFSIEFSALDYDNPETVMYSYRLVGFDDKWISVPSNRRFASFTNLQPGTYTLQVKCTSPDSHFDNNNIVEIRIKISPYFYKTIWFISLSILVIGFLIYHIYRFRVAMLKKQKKELHRKVIERTQAIEEQKEELKQKNEVLVEQNNKISMQRQELIKMSDKIQEAMNDKVNFYTNITHEFRTPITLIIGPIEKALKLSTNPKVIEQLHYVSRNSKHLLSLVNQLMDFRKIEAEQMSIIQVYSNFISFLEEILIPFEAYAQERNVKITTFYRLANPYILFDKEAMYKVISNLLSNALKFTSSNGRINIYVSAIQEHNEQKLYIAIVDNGLGINDDEISMLFNRFFQSKTQASYTVSGQSGTGIGLYLCKNIIELLKGTIYAKNNKKQGASFRIILPLKQEEIAHEKMIETININPDIESRIVDNKKDIVSDKSTTILIVEDNIDMRSFINSILADFYNVIEANNGEEALSILKEQSIDFIISDLMMPVMDGLELSKKVKQDIKYSHIPFLMLTAKTSQENRIASYKVGVNEYLNKPFDEDVLLARIQNILETRKNYQRKFGMFMDIEDLNIEKQSKDDIFMDKAIATIKKNYKNADYEVGNFINDMGMSKSLISQKMQTLTGLSAGQFIRNYRLNLAREIILKNQQNKNIIISEVAYEVGFNDPKYFTRCFTKQFGISPSSLLKN